MYLAGVASSSNQKMWQINLQLEAKGASPWLRALEAQLVAEFPSLTLIGEYDANEADHAMLQRRLLEAMGGVFQQKVWPGLLIQYPRAIALHLVLAGIYGYESGDYWSHTVMGADAPATLKRETGFVFEKVCKRDGLARFLGHTGYRFVTPILLHGGIPNNSLSSFYQVCIRPAALDSNFASRELIDYWLTESSARYLLPKPVKRFLEQRGAIVEDFVLRCIEAAVELEHGADDASLNSIGLPRRVVREFQECFVSAIPVAPSKATRVTVPTPRIFFDPDVGGVWCRLPGIEIPQGTDVDIEWRVKCGTSEIYQRVSSNPLGDRFISEEEQVYIANPASVFEIALSWNHELRRTWTLKAALDDELFLFSAQSGQLIEARGFIPATELWIIADAGALAEADKGVKVEEGPNLNDGWSSCIAIKWDLTEAKTYSANKKSWTVSAEGATEPHLSGGRFFDRRQRHSSIEYAEWPEVILPLTGVTTFETECQRWRLSVTAEGRRATTDDEVSIVDHARKDGRKIVVDLARIAPPEPGAFQVSIKGGLGHRASWSIKYTAGARILEHPVPRIPSQGLWQEQGLEISVPDDLYCNPLTSGLSVETAPSGERRTILFNRSTASGIVRFQHRQTRALVDVSVGVPSLAWRLSPGGAEWATKPLELSREAIEAARAYLLQVRMLPSFLDTKLDARALVTEGLTEHEMTAQQRAAHEMSFDLRQLSGISDTRRARTALSLVLGRSHSRVPVFILSEELRLEHFSATVLNGPKTHTLRFEWYEAGPRLRDRMIRLWSRSRPWESRPFDLQVDDQCDGNAKFEISRAEIRPGEYFAQMVVDDPWRGVRDRYPDSRNPAVCEITVGTQHDVYGTLESLPNNAEANVEKAIAYETADYDRCSAALTALEAFPASIVIPFICRALIGASRGRTLDELFSDKRRVALLEFRRQLNVAPRELLAFVDKTLSRQGQDAWPDMRELLIHCGALLWTIGLESGRDSHFPRLWSYWPAYAVTILAPLLIEGDRQTVELFTQGCGSSEIFESQSTDDLESHSPAVKADLYRRDDVFGAFQPEVRTLELCAVKLRMQRDSTGAMRNRIFDPDGWLHVSYEWIIESKAEESASLVEALKNSQRWLASLIGKLQRSNEAVVSDLSTLVLARYDRSDRHRLINIPFVVGAVALIHRTWALRPSERSCVSQMEFEWRKLTRPVLALAPSLFDRDMAFIALAFAQADQSRV